VLDGIIPQYLSDKDKILERSKNVWDKYGYNEDNDKLKVEMLKNYGVRFYHQEIVRKSDKPLFHQFSLKTTANPHKRYLT
jgi:hypothetical protein